MIRCHTCGVRTFEIAEFQEDEKAESIEITLSTGFCGDLPWPADCRDPIIPFLIEQMILAC